MTKQAQAVAYNNRVHAMGAPWPEMPTVPRTRCGVAMYGESSATDSSVTCGNCLRLMIAPISQFLAEYAELNPVEQGEVRARIAALGARCSLHGVRIERGSCWACESQI